MVVVVVVVVTSSTAGGGATLGIIRSNVGRVRWVAEVDGRDDAFCRVDGGELDAGWVDGWVVDGVDVGLLFFVRLCRLFCAVLALRRWDGWLFFFFVAFLVVLVDWVTCCCCCRGWVDSEIMNSVSNTRSFKSYHKTQYTMNSNRRVNKIDVKIRRIHFCSRMTTVDYI